MSKPRKRRLRPVALAAVRRADGAVLVQRGRDESRALTFHRLIGGGIDFGETAEQAVVREWQEELSAQLLDVRLLGWVENLFTFEGAPGHELLAVHVGRVDDPHVLDRDDLGTIPGTTSTVHWVPGATVLHGPVPLYPPGVVRLLQPWLRDG
ncbi:NUDIX hydrolase [Aquipuribacter sp. MA13-6]|uniref:NUDIX hydrolase n=1 Tax=unclassified Aquipuribacter TaxID=2635084 RepID=UPI003EEE6A47